jgi:hypothetical protein
MSWVPVLGPYQSVTIDGTARWSTALAPGLYCCEAESSACHVDLKATNANPNEATTSNQRIASGGGRYFRVGSGSSDPKYLAVIRSGSSTGTLHINKVG